MHVSFADTSARSAGRSGWHVAVRASLTTEQGWPVDSKSIEHCVQIDQGGTVTRTADLDLQRFAENGFVVLTDVVPESLLKAADDEIDALIVDTPPHEGDGGPGQNAWFMPRSRLPHSEAALRSSPALAIASELVAPHQLDFAFDHIQVATTVPAWRHIPGGPHIDGHGPGQDPPASFTLLAGILLTDQTAPSSGNLWVWPGSHLIHQNLFRDRGPRVLQQTGGTRQHSIRRCRLASRYRSSAVGAISCSHTSFSGTTRVATPPPTSAEPSTTGSPPRGTLPDGSARSSTHGQSSRQSARLGDRGRRPGRSDLSSVDTGDPGSRSPDRRTVGRTRLRDGRAQRA